MITQNTSIYTIIFKGLNSTPTSNMNKMKAI